jgi:energy-coupling factor transporter transmembrane protein EcfT
MSKRPVPRIDARVGVGLFVAIAAAALALVSTSAAMALLLAWVVLLYAAALAGARLFGHFRRLAPVLVLIVVLNGVFVPGEAVLSVAGKTLLSRAGLSSGVFFSLRLAVLYFAMALFLAVTPPVEFARGIYSILRPFSIRLANRVAFHGFLILSFIPLFTDELDRIRRAQSFRGAEFGGGIARRAAAARALIVPLLLSAIHRSGQLSAVVELRGLRDRVGTVLPPVRPGMADAIVAAATAAVLAAIIWLQKGPAA